MGLQCLLTWFPIKNRIKTRQNRPDSPKMTNGLAQHITAEESTVVYNRLVIVVVSQLSLSLSLNYPLVYSIENLINTLFTEI